MKKYIIQLIICAFAVNAFAQGDYQRTAKGTQYKIVTPHVGDRIKMSDIVTFNAIQKTEKDSILFSSYQKGAPMQAQIKPDGDLMDIFPLLTVKDSVLIKIPTDSLFKDPTQPRPSFLPKGSNMYFVLKIERVQSLEEAMAERKALIDKYATEEAAAADKYIVANKLTLMTTASGLKYKVNLPSIKRKPLAGDTVLVNYTGKTLDGKVFDSSVQADALKGGLNQPGRNYEPIKFVVGNGEVIPGWDEGLLLLGEGAKATFVIPSKLAYGDRGAGEDIKPFATLVFDVQLVKVKPVKHVAKPGAKKTVAKKKVTTTTIKKKS